VTDTKLFYEAVERSGKRKEYLANKCGITVQSLRRKATNLSYFTNREIEILCEELGIETPDELHRIFFAQNVDKTSTEEG